MYYQWFLLVAACNFVNRWIKCSSTIIEKSCLLQTSLSMAETYWHGEFGEVFANAVLDKTPEVEADIGFGRDGGPSGWEGGLNLVKETRGDLGEDLREGGGGR